MQTQEAIKKFLLKKKKCNKTEIFLFLTEASVLYLPTLSSGLLQDV